MAQDRQIDDNQDDLGRAVNNPNDRIGDRATADKAHDVTRKTGLERQDKRNKDDPAENVSGGFNQKSRPDGN